MASLSEVIRNAKNGDASAVAALVFQFSGVIQKECIKYSLGLPPDLSHSDLVQEVLMRVLTKIHQFKGGDQEECTAMIFGSWIRKNARSTLNNLFRDRNAQKRMPKDGLEPFDEGVQEYHEHQCNGPGPSSIFAMDEEVERLRVAMCYLDDRTREILNRYFVEGQSFKRISEEMSLSYDQVRFAFHTAQAKLAKWLT